MWRIKPIRRGVSRKRDARSRAAGEVGKIDRLFWFNPTSWYLTSNPTGLAVPPLWQRRANSLPCPLLKSLLE